MSGSGPLDLPPPGIPPRHDGPLPDLPPSAAPPQDDGPVEAVLVQGRSVPESAMDVALLGTPSLVTLKENTEGPTMKVRIIRACNEWVEGDEPTVNADYGKQLIDNGLAEEIRETAQTSRKSKP